MAETRRKLEPARKESIAPASKLAWWSEISCSARKMRSKEDISLREDFAAVAPVGEQLTASPHVPHVPHGIRDSTQCQISGKSQEELRIHEDAANARAQRDESNRETTNDDAAAGSRTPLGNAGLWARDMAGSVQSELLNYELSHRLMLHQLEVCDSANSVQLASTYIELFGIRERLQGTTIMLQTEEKRLKVKIAEMAIQEIRFRIQALNEDIRRADELHELHLALATAQAVSPIGSVNARYAQKAHSPERPQWLH